jgi:hypothetical protein
MFLVLDIGSLLYSDPALSKGEIFFFFNTKKQVTILKSRVSLGRGLVSSLPIGNILIKNFI